ncbi:MULTISPECIES: cutinase family protein [unclassified Mycobacterium]|uniref:cutinase family protein n=1 Tax=Mycobacterium sp. DL99 TaxID=2528957 RepID=UPI00108014C2|nr:cutinase family protein [Mycobacterium sp. DL99]
MPVAVVFTGPTPAATADPCADVEVVFARGTGEPPGIGRVGQAMVDRLGALIAPRSLGVYAVNYPAGLNFLTTADAANDAAGHIAWLADQCPDTRVVLGGFSQGAAAVSMLAGVPPIGDRIGTIGSAPALPPPSADRVAAVAVFGNPGNRFGTPLSSTGQFAGRAIDLCSPGDPICVEGGRVRAAHSAYELPPYPDQAAGFIAGRV